MRAGLYHSIKIGRFGQTQQVVILDYRIGVNTTAPFYHVVKVLDVVVFKFWMKFYPKMGKKAPKMGLLGKKMPLYSNLLQGAVIIKTAVVFMPIR